MRRSAGSPAATSSATAPSSIGYSVRPFGEIAMPSKPLEFARFGAWPGGQGRVLTATPRPGVGTGASSSRPSASVCSRNGPNSSPNQKVPSGASCIDSMSKSQPVSTRSGAGHA